LLLLQKVGIDEKGGSIICLLVAFLMLLRQHTLCVVFWKRVY
jgi:hypothetical protein